MNRRLFMAGAAALMAAPKLVLAGGMNTVAYTPGLIKEKLAAGETVLVDYAADWCGTCKRQERVISDLRASNPAFDEHISFVRVNWDQYSSHEVASSRNVPRRSTLLLLKGDEELDRIIAEVDPARIQEMMEKGLAAA